MSLTLLPLIGKPSAEDLHSLANYLYSDFLPLKPKLHNVEVSKGKVHFNFIFGLFYFFKGLGVYRLMRHFCILIVCFMLIEMERILRNILTGAGFVS